MMSGINEAKRLVHQYDLAFKNGRQKLFSEKGVHIGVLETAIVILETQIDDLSEELAHWGEAIAYEFEARLTVPKWMIFHRFVMFLLRKYAEHQYGKVCEEIVCANEFKDRMEYFLKQFEAMSAWKN